MPYLSMRMVEKVRWMWSERSIGCYVRKIYDSAMAAEYTDLIEL